jgi:hypothetical protein
MAPDPAPHRTRDALAYAGAWTLLGLYFASKAVLDDLIAGRRGDVGAALTGALADAWVWALLAIPVMGLARRFRFVPGRVALAFAIHAPAAMAAAALEVLATAPIARGLGLVSLGPGGDETLLARLLVGRLHQNLATYALVVAVTQTIEWRRRTRDREHAGPRLTAIGTGRTP